MSRSGRLLAMVADSDLDYQNGGTGLFFTEAEGTPEPVSLVATNGEILNGIPTNLNFALDGELLFFDSLASNFPGAEAGKLSIYVYHRSTGAIERITTGKLACGTHSVSEDGNEILVGNENSTAWHVLERSTNTKTLVVGNQHSGELSLSRDGSTVGFVSRDVHVAGASATARNAYALKWRSGQYQLVSANLGGLAGDQNSMRVLFSDDGSKAAFYSSATNLSAGDDNLMPDLFWKDIATGEIRRLTKTPPRSVGYDQDIYRPVFSSWAVSEGFAAISSDGMKVAFSTCSDDIVVPDDNLGSDVLLYDVQASSYRRLSETEAGEQALAPGQTSLPSISADGSTVAYSTAATYATGARVQGRLQRHDLDHHLGIGTLNRLHFSKKLDRNRICLDVSSTGQLLGSSLIEYLPVSLNRTGEFAAFRHVNWLQGDALDTPVRDLEFMRDLWYVFTGSAPKVVNSNSSGIFANDQRWGALSTGPSAVEMAPDGSEVLFDSTGTNLVSNTPSADTRVYIKNLVDGSVQALVTKADGTPAKSSSPHITSSGEEVVFSSWENDLNSDGLGEGIFVYNRLDQSLSRVDVDASGQKISRCYFPRISGNGRYVAFFKGVTPSVDGPLPRNPLYLKDRLTGEVVWVSRPVQLEREEGNPYSLGSLPSFLENSENYRSTDPVSAREVALSEDGRFVVYIDRSNLISAEDQNPGSDVYIFDREQNTNVLLTRNAQGVSSLGHCTAVDISADGKWIVFDSTAADLIDGDDNQVGDVFMIYNPFLLAE